MISNAFSIATSGLARARAQHTEAASNVVRASLPCDPTSEVGAAEAEGADMANATSPTPLADAPTGLISAGPDLAGAMVDQMIAVTAYRANAATFRTADETTQSLLDAFA